MINEAPKIVQLIIRKELAIKYNFDHTELSFGGLTFLFSEQELGIVFENQARSWAAFLCFIICKMEIILLLACKIAVRFKWVNKWQAFGIVLGT